MYTVYGDMLSGNCYKIKLLMCFLDIGHRWVHVDILSGATHTDEFRKMNPNARIPVIVLPDGRHLWESNAILNYLAQGSAWLPEAAYDRARVLQWQFFEQYSHEPYVATARYISKYLGLPPEREAEYHAKQQGGHKALAVMEQHLAEHAWFVGREPTIADISLYAYTHVAPEGGFSLDGYPAVRRWCADVETIPGYVKMDRANA